MLVNKFVICMFLFEIILWLYDCLCCSSTWTVASETSVMNFFKLSYDVSVKYAPEAIISNYIWHFRKILQQHQILVLCDNRNISLSVLKTWNSRNIRNNMNNISTQQHMNRNIWNNCVTPIKMKLKKTKILLSTQSSSFSSHRYSIQISLWVQASAYWIQEEGTHNSTNKNKIIKHHLCLFMLSCILVLKRNYISGCLSRIMGTFLPNGQ